MKKSFIFQLVFIFCIVLNASAQTANTGAEKLSFILENMQISENNTADLEVDYREEILYSNSAETQKIEGNLKFLRPQRFFIIQNTPQMQKIYINSNIITVYTPSNKQAIINNWKDLINSDWTPISAVNFASYWRKMSKTHTLKFIRENKDIYFLELSPKNASWSISVEISKESFRIVKMLLKDDIYNVNISLFNYKTNQNIDRKIFNFIPPKGVEIIKLN